MYFSPATFGRWVVGMTGGAGGAGVVPPSAPGAQRGRNGCDGGFGPESVTGAPSECAALRRAYQSRFVLSTAPTKSLELWRFGGITTIIWPHQPANREEIYVCPRCHRRPSLHPWVARPQRPG